MKIVFVSKEYPPSKRSYGIGTYTEETARALTEAGHAVTVIAASDDSVTETEIVQHGVHVYRLPDDELGVSSNKLLRMILPPTFAYQRYRTRVADCLDRLIDTGAAEIVEFPGFRGESDVWARRPRRIPMVVRMHGFTGWVDRFWRDRVSATRRLQKRLETRELRSADFVTTVAAHLLPAVVSGVPRTKATALHNGIRTELWVKGGQQTATCVTRKDILFVGSHTRVKGLFVLIEAAARLRHSAQWSGKLVLAGRTGREFKRFIERRWGENMPSWIYLLGHQSRHSLAALYGSAGVCCFPSLIEPLGYTCIEAMASGGLVVASDRTGMAEAITHGQSGFLVQPGDVTGLMETLELALSLSPGACVSIRASAQQSILRKFDFSVKVPEIVSLFENISAGKGVSNLSGKGSAECC